MSGNIKSDEYLFFFKLYNAFLQIDSVASMVYGRNRELIKKFFNVYLKIANNDNALEESKNDLKIAFEEYVKLMLHLYNKDTMAQHSTYPHVLNNPNITEAFREFAEAVEKYQKWRLSLTPHDIKTIYIANLNDRHKYYTNKPFDTEININIDTQTMQNNQILKQSIIEFHNAISHLNSIFFTTRELNKQKAINHFIRGSLDSYKAIIKDYFCLLNDDKKVECSHFDKVKALRQKEYGIIGSDNKNKVLQEYKLIASDMINEKNKAINTNNT